MAKEAAEEAKGGSVRAVERAARIVTALAEHPFPMSVTELAVRVDLSPPSVHRLLATLVRIGWVEQNSRTARYRLGTRMMGIGSAGLVVNPIVQHGKNFLQRLSELTGYDSLLSTLVGARVVNLARVQGRLGRVFEFEPGVSMPAHAMADGKLLLSYLTEMERRYLYQVETLRSYTSLTIVDPEQLEEELSAIRRRGYAIDRGERFEGRKGLAVPIMGVDERPLLAMMSMGIADLTPELERTLQQQMTSIAHEMAAQLEVVGDMPQPGVAFSRHSLE